MVLLTVLFNVLSISLRLVGAVYEELIVILTVHVQYDLNPTGFLGFARNEGHFFRHLLCDAS